MLVACSGDSGVMNRVKTVRSGKRSAISVTVGSTRTIHPCECGVWQDGCGRETVGSEVG